MAPFITNVSLAVVWVWASVLVAVLVVAFLTVAAVVSLFAFPFCVGVLMLDQRRERRRQRVVEDKQEHARDGDGICPGLGPGGEGR